jgi:hypothetical protein
MTARRALLLVGLAFVVYAYALGGSFHFDDAHAVVENPSIRSLGNLGRFFTDAGTFSVLAQNQGYRPLLLVTYALTAALTGVNSHAFIFVNLVVHALCALMVGFTTRQILHLLGRKEDDDIAFFAALIFAVHPLFSECVSYVSARSESLSGLFMLIALFAYLKKSPRWLALSALSITAALLVKPTVTIFPLLLILFEAALRDPLRKIAPRFLLLTAVVVAFGLLGAKMTPAFAIRSASNFTRREYLRSELPAIWHYLRLFVLPIGQSGDPNYPTAKSFFEPRVIAAGLGLAALLGFCIWGLVRRRYLGIALAIGWFLVCIFPASSIFPLAEIVNEHRPYMAAASLCVLAAAALVRLPQRILPAILLALLLSLSLATFLRTRAWHDESTLWADVTAKSPTSTRAQMNYGLALMSSGHLTEAEPHLREAVRLGPRYSYAHINLGNLLSAQGHIEEARGQLDLGITLGHELFWAHYFRGLFAEKVKEPPAQRMKYFLATTHLAPNYAPGWTHLAKAREDAGDLAGAQEASRRAAALK